MGVVYKGKIVARMGWGQVYRFYDLASLTKILFTTTAFMDLVETKNLNLQCKLQSFAPLELCLDYVGSVAEPQC